VTQMPIQSGDRAPDFVVPAVHEDRTITLADYRGKMAASSEQLRSLGVDSLAIVGTELDNARSYFKFRPMRLALGADPHLTTHRSYGVPRPEITPELAQMMGNTYINPTGELPAPLPVQAAAAALAALDGYQVTPTDRRDQELTSNQLKGQFLIDRDGFVRWSHIECGSEGLSGMGKSASHEELLGAASFVIGSSSRAGT